jgi:hypothetical protein
MHTQIVPGQYNIVAIGQSAIRAVTLIAIPFSVITSGAATGAAEKYQEHYYY